MKTNDSSDESDPIDPQAYQAIEKHVRQTCSHLGIRDPRLLQELTASVWDRMRRRPELADASQRREFVDMLNHVLSPLTLAAKAEPACAAALRGLLRDYPREGQWWQAYYRDGTDLRRIASASGEPYMKVWRGIRRYNEQLYRCLGEQGEAEGDSG